MSAFKNKVVAILRALPLAHLLILALIALSLLIGISFLPNQSATRSQAIIIPEELLGRTKVVVVKSGDNFSLVADRADLSSTHVFQIMESGEEAKRLLNLYPGQKISFYFDKFDELLYLSYQPSITDTLIVTKTGDAFSAQLQVKTLTTRVRYASGTINDSLFLAANKAGLNDNVTMELADILGWDIDFALDIRVGDQFGVMYEEFLLDGKFVKSGNILATKFINQDKEITALRFQDSTGEVGYFTPEGLSMRKTFRRNPLDIVRITSRFNLRRKHPVLHKIRAHRGVDYAAGKGTPIRATGDGKVVNARRKGGFGNTVIIQHGQKYNTLYAHLSKYGRGIREGRTVKQGQIIGYVGSTGLATGPHLHYEFRVNGVHRNPLTVSLPLAKPIKSAEKDNFMKHAKHTLEKFHEFQQAAILK